MATVSESCPSLGMKLNICELQSIDGSNRISVTDNVSNTVQDIPLDLWSCQQAILDIIAHPSEPICTGKAQYSNWYAHYLDKKIRDLYLSPLMNSTLSFIAPQFGLTGRQPDILVTCIYRCFVVIAKELDSGSTSIVIISQKLMELKHDSISSSPGQDLSQLYQFIFKGISMITMLFEVADNPAPSRLQLLLPTTKLRKTSRFKHSSIWHNLECPITDGSGGTMQMDIDHLLSHFGDLVPRTCYSTSENGQNLYDDTIIASNINFDALSKIGKLSIEWVESLSLHLELHERSSVLRLFRFPSFCALLCSRFEAPETLLSKIVSIPEPRSRSYSISATEGQYAYSSDFLIEVLCSYRLIFGQHRASYETFVKIRPSGFRDPLLETLCGKSCIKHDFYDELEAGASKNVYSASSDFPLIGRRILVLQDYMNAQNPSDLRTLWYDKRDILRWYTFWAVVVVGGVSILLSIISTVLTAVQVSQLS
ncbi:hypothetical protein BP5796_10778 [Coleophoma crateriformis]|uniref:Uncharacterized protein n=1 Tax=Coleophoma crateriformis TaxID=565419 RepID=A0A3D8QR28_9HELO|nr:hypothetical protein BP5796_10778 [Coleophoma crateriformis]